MLACTFSLILSPTAGNYLPRIDKLFLPISSTVRNTALSLVKEPVKDPESKERQASLKNENERLTKQNFFLEKELERLRNLTDIMNKSGIPNPTLVGVIGGDFGNQQVLSLKLPSGMKLDPGAPVYSPKGAFAGRLEIVGIGAARVRLVTDKASRIQANFARFDSTGGHSLPHAGRIVQGTGDGKMMIEGVKRADLIALNNPELKLAPGDWVVVDDHELLAAQYKKIGEIEAIVESNKALFVNIIIRADEPLLRLTQVLVSKN